MPVCVECGSPVPHLFCEYGKTNIVLTRCVQKRNQVYIIIKNYLKDNCGSVADKYVEFDQIIIVLDMILHKTPVYRHLLLNSPSCQSIPEQEWFRRNWRSFLLFVVFDVFMNWSRMERERNGSSMTFFYRYLSLLIYCSFEMILHIVTVILFFRAYLSLVAANKSSKLSPSRIAESLIQSSFSKGLLVLILIWNYEGLRFAWLVNISVMTLNAEALHAVLNEPYWECYAAVILGNFTRYIVHLAINNLWDHELVPSFL